MGIEWGEHGVYGVLIEALLAELPFGILLAAEKNRVETVILEIDQVRL